MSQKLYPRYGGAPSRPGVEYVAKMPSERRSNYTGSDLYSMSSASYSSGPGSPSVHIRASHPALTTISQEPSLTSDTGSYEIPEVPAPPESPRRQPRVHTKISPRHAHNFDPPPTLPYMTTKQKNYTRKSILKNSNVTAEPAIRGSPPGGPAELPRQPPPPPPTRQKYIDYTDSFDEDDDGSFDDDEDNEFATPQPQSGSPPPPPPPVLPQHRRTPTAPPSVPSAPPSSNHPSQHYDSDDYSPSDILSVRGERRSRSRSRSRVWSRSQPQSRSQSRAPQALLPSMGARGRNPGSEAPPSSYYIPPISHLPSQRVRRSPSRSQPHRYRSRSRSRPAYHHHKSYPPPGSRRRSRSRIRHTELLSSDDDEPPRYLIRQTSRRHHHNHSQSRHRHSDSPRHRHEPRESRRHRQEREAEEAKLSAELQKQIDDVAERISKLVDDPYATEAMVANTELKFERLFAEEPAA